MSFFFVLQFLLLEKGGNWYLLNSCTEIKEIKG